MAETYQIARSPYRGHLTWWAPDETVPPNYTLIRDATAEEAVQITEIIDGDTASDNHRVDVAWDELKRLFAASGTDA